MLQLRQAMQRAGDERPAAGPVVDRDGGFHGHRADDYVDAEYTYYGLLALGRLAI